MHMIHVQSTNCKTIFYCLAFEIVGSLVEQVKNDYSFKCVYYYVDLFNNQQREFAALQKVLQTFVKTRKSRNFHT